MHKSLYLVPTLFRLFVTIIRRGESNKTTYKYNIDGIQKLLEIKLKGLKLLLCLCIFDFFYNFTKKSTSLSEIN